MRTTAETVLTIVLLVVPGGVVPGTAVLGGGRIAPGLRAGLVRIRAHEGLPAMRQVRRAGERVA